MGYILVNPRIGNSTFESSRKDPMEAADMIWAKLSENIKYYTPKFFFTIQNKKTSKLTHYEVNEELEESSNQEGGDNDANSESSISSTERKSSNRVKCTISEFKNVDTKIMKKFLHELKIEQDGGKPKFLDDSSSSSSSSSSIVYNISPSGSFPLTYFPTIYGVPKLVLPTFLSPLTPFTNIVLLGP